MKNPPATQPIAWKDVPGPRGWPLVGNAFQIDRKHLHLQLEEWARQYGSVFAFSIGRRRFLVITNPEAAAKVLRARPDGFGRQRRLEQVAREFGFVGLFTVGGETWKRHRPMVMASFDPAHIKAFFPTLVTVTERLAGRWRVACASGRTIDLHADLMRFTVDVTAAITFGEDVNTIEAGEEAIQAHMECVLPALARRVLSPFDPPRWWKTRAQRELRGHIDALQAAVQSFIAKARDRMEADPTLRERPQNMIQAMVARRDATTDVTDEDISGNALMMLLAAKDTTANTLTWLMWMLARNPTARASAVREAREVLAGAVCPTTPEQLARLDWIEACANEAMRLKPVVPSISNEVLQPCVVEGVQLEPGMTVLCLLRPAAVSEANFAAAREFRPERWLAGIGGSQQGLNSAKRVAMPFGAGPRTCPGRYLALSEIKMAAAMLLANFDIDWVAPPGGGEPEEVLAITMAPSGMEMRVRAAAKNPAELAVVAQV
ncbi:MAG TPA: cytochrome P450 [Ramlibacter sp.]|uniref:cytochrome P450 n=1 Tax=Ramlibacter sp. TaxID=1917967 RepID=UPI002C43F8D9|nr:cytochrome P450 [Ramlibacter sp.]HVZ43402.1 cytochrome P450 [Ramlibacter sp.]